MEVTFQGYQVSFEWHADESVSPEEIEDELERLVTVLVEKAAGLALGPAGAIHGSIIEVLCNVEAVDTAEMYSKLHDIAVILGDTSEIDFAATSARRGDRELVLA